jgi:uncharacterized protein YvpB
MTVVLGKRPASPKVNPADERKAQWVEQFHKGRRCGDIPAGPPPVPMAEVRMHMPAVDAAGRPQRRSCQDGLVGLYASRVDAQRARRMTTGRRLHPGSISGPCTIVRETQCVGRASARHYETLYPHPRPEWRPVRLEGGSMRGIVGQTIATVRKDARTRLSPPAWHHLFRASAHFHRMAAPRRMVMATMAALLILSAAATSTLAAQQRYEVQAGDTLESIAAEFGVDPEGIYRSSWMPNGWAVEPGQVIVIPSPDQSPAEAAQMAAEREGTSPWVMGAHWVEYGDTLDTIGAAWGISPQVLMTFNGITDPTTLYAGQRILIPYEREDQTMSTIAQRAPAVSIPVPDYTQSRNLSCEFAATYAATAAFGSAVPEQVFIDSTPLANNPHYGYRGNIDGWWGNTDDYGVYAEALVPTLNAHGYYGEVMYTGGDTGPLVTHLDAGHPVVVWLGFWGDTRQVLDDEGTYSVFAGMHVVTVTGYDAEGVYVMDPAKGRQQFYDWATFEELWSVVDGMGLAVYPM